MSYRRRTLRTWLWRSESAPPNFQVSTQYFSPLLFPLLNGTVPLNTIRGGICERRIDGICEMGKFPECQPNADTLANYDFACFGNHIKDSAESRGQDYDGTVPA